MWLWSFSAWRFRDTCAGTFLFLALRSVRIAEILAIRPSSQLSISGEREPGHLHSRHNRPGWGNFMIRTHAMRAACTLFLSFSIGTGVANAANPLGLAWKTTQNVELYAKPTGMVVTGRCNAADPKFAAARAKGAEVLVYLDPIERPDNYVCAPDAKFFMGDYGRVPLWPYPSYGHRIEDGGQHLTDMRPGSAWILSVVKYVETLMRERKVDGVFLDVVGGQLW